ncbi:hypothetical protein TRAPUB_6179 [Trametes pubescens]|uniref:Nucleic acid-binding protein n=1 Tax=Trametes pubescens TaxID=154538 RepID=A0A1M2W6W2_TRAPU|nr:hypothetical protein TRAPUB_6179 [Trametes pubescens]
MPPMSFVGQVTKVGFMNKTATISVSRFVFHPKTGKVRLRLRLRLLTRPPDVLIGTHDVLQRLERSKKYLTHDEENTLRMKDTVLIRNCPPISARKRFTVEKVIKSPEREREELHARQAAEAALRQQQSSTSTASA